MTQQLLVGVGAAATFSAGCWQTYRLQWKRQLIAERESRVKGSPLTNKEFAADTAPHTRVKLRGSFQDDAYCFLGPGPAPKSANPLPRENPDGYEIGVNVLAPFLVDDPQPPAQQPRKRGLFASLWKTEETPVPSHQYQVLVNRGWIPWSDYKNWRETGSVPEYLKIQSPTTVHGVTQPDDKPTKKVVFDMPRVHPLLRAQEILEKDAPPVIGCTAITAFSVEAVDPRNFLRAADPTIPLIRRPLPATRGADDFIFGYVTPEKHIEYATFWFGCCLSVLVLHYAVGRRGTRGRRPRLR